MARAAPLAGSGVDPSEVDARDAMRVRAVKVGAIHQAIVHPLVCLVIYQVCPPRIAVKDGATRTGCRAIVKARRWQCGRRCGRRWRWGRRGVGRRRRREGRPPRWQGGRRHRARARCGKEERRREDSASDARRRGKEDWRRAAEKKMARPKVETLRQVACCLLRAIDCACTLDASTVGADACGSAVRRSAAQRVTLARPLCSDDSPRRPRPANLPSAPPHPSPAPACSRSAHLWPAPILPRAV